MDAATDPAPLSLGRIPVLAHVPLYATVVDQCLDDPQLLVAWCVFAVWNPIDQALGQTPTLETWVQRTLLPPEHIERATQELIRRGLLTRAGRIPHLTLNLESIAATRLYTDALRHRAGLPPLGPIQADFLEQAVP